MSHASARAGGEPATGGQSTDPQVLMRSRQYRGLLVVSALIGVVVSIASWGFLEATHWLQQALYFHLPKALGFDSAPWWWPLPVLAVAGLVIAFAIVRLPGHGGHEPSEGLKTGAPTTPVELPGVILAAIATVGLGLVLGPEAPLIALGGGVALLLVDRARQPVPDQAKLVLAAAGGFAALATIFGSPVIGAVIIIEAAGIGGPMLPLILLPGLLASGIGSLVFVGIGNLTGLSTNAYALPPLALPAYPTPQLLDFLWTVPLALVAAGGVFAVMTLGRSTRSLVARRPFLLIPLAALVVGLVAIAFAQISGQTADAVLFSGQDEMSATVQGAETVSLGTIALLLVAKALAWGVSLGAARGGPTFPAIFLGLAGGLLASHLPGFAETPAVGVLIGASVVAVLRLPLSAIVLALLITQAGAGVAPLVIVSVVVAYIGTLVLSARGTVSRGP
ncbi:chloride channel protein [Kribbella sp. CA-245084]|uniref:chloride channel protein n=1 Tax=Kribbella sp. CA-245084 TaxID=3239940 RepID=UPI003D92A922